MENFVSLLNQKCQKHKTSLPKYFDDDETDEPSAVKKCLCELEGLSTTGYGQSKKLARGKAAELMLQKIETENWTPILESKPQSDSAITKMNVFSDKHKKNKPLISEMDKDGDLFVIEIKFDGYTAIGKGSNKKIAKEAAAQDVVKHFNIDIFYDNLLKLKENKKKEEAKNPIQILYEICQARNLNTYFAEHVVMVGKTQNYTITCTVSDLLVKSQPNFSKKNAKLEAANLMCEKLNNTKYFNTPDSSPIPKYSKPEDEDSNDGVPEAKRVRILKDFDLFQ